MNAFREPRFESGYDLFIVLLLLFNIYLGQYCAGDVGVEVKRCSEIFGALWRDDDGSAREILSKVEQDNDG